MKQQNSYNVPQQTWSEFGERGQEFFNRLYEACKSKRQELVQNAPQQLREGQQKETLNTVIDQITLQVASEATRQYIQQEQTTH
jgi:hypothetical protein